METTLNESIDVQPHRLRNLLRDVVDIYSPSGKEEEVLELLEALSAREITTTEAEEEVQNAERKKKDLCQI